MYLYVRLTVFFAENADAYNSISIAMLSAMLSVHVMHEQHGDEHGDEHKIS